MGQGQKLEGVLEATAIFQMRDDGGQANVMAWKRQKSDSTVRGRLDKFAEG